MKKAKIILTNITMRVFVGIAFPVAAVAGFVLLHFTKIGVPCLFHSFTGLYCPGCGATRALRALLDFNIVRALDYNTFVVLMLPFIAYYLLKLYIRYVFGKDFLPFPETIPVPVFVVIISFILIFTVLRNIPVFPFILLAP